MINQLSINPKQEKEKIVDFLKKTFKEQKITKVILGLSGGVDSTVVLYLFKEVLPLNNIFVVQMDYNSRKKTNIDLKGVNVVDISIKNIVDQFKVKDSINKIRLGNIMTRVRMIILFDLAKQLNAMVCGTENKSEKLLGYFTRFGDAASDIEPISHLYKTQIYQLAKYLKVPEQIVNQSPTAGLWDGQTDEGELGFTYSEADQVLHLYFDKKKKLEEIIKLGFKNSDKIIKRSLNNQFKLKTPYHL